MELTGIYPSVQRILSRSVLGMVGTPTRKAKPTLKIRCIKMRGNRRMDEGLHLISSRTPKVGHTLGSLGQSCLTSSAVGDVPTHYLLGRGNNRYSGRYIYGQI